MHSVSTILKTLIHLWKKNTYQEKGQRLAFPESTWLNSFPSFCLRLTSLFWCTAYFEEWAEISFCRCLQKILPRDSGKVWFFGFGDLWVSNGWWSPSMKWIDDLDLQSFVFVKPSDESWRGRITGIQRDGNVSWSLRFIWSFLKSSWTEKRDLNGHRIVARLPQGDVTKLDEPDQDAKFCQAYGKTKDVSRRKEKLGRKWRNFVNSPSKNVHGTFTSPRISDT